MRLAMIILSLMILGILITQAPTGIGTLHLSTVDVSRKLRKQRPSLVNLAAALLFVVAVEN